MFREGKVPLFFTAMRYMDDDIWQKRFGGMKSRIYKSIDWNP